MNDVLNYNDYAGVTMYMDDDNPCLSSPNAPYDLPFYQTRSTLIDVEIYKGFLNNCITRFRRSRYYKSYKAYLMGLGMDKCVILGNVDDSMAEIQMHHNFLTIHDIALMITEHMINTIGKISSFDLINLLIQEHQDNRVPIVMLSETMHEVYHSDQMYFIPPNATFGKWWELIYKYRYGITIDIAKKIVAYIDRYSNTPEGNMYVSMRNDILSFSSFNEYGYDPNKCVTVNQLSNGKPSMFIPEQL